MSRKRAVAFGLTAAVLMAAVAGAWWLQSSSDDDYSVTVIRSGREVGSFDVEQLRDLPQRAVKVDGKTESGPSVLDVLEAAGVADFSAVTVRGMGLRDSGARTFTRAELGPAVLLDFAQRGTVKVVSPGLAWEDRVRDVTVIEVR